MNLVDLNATVRERMINELFLDSALGRVFVNKSLHADAAHDFPHLLHTAFVFHTSAWLSAEIRSHKMLASNSRVTYDDSMDTADLVGQSTYHSYFCRGLCLHAISLTPKAELEIYRAKPGLYSPPCEHFVGTRVRAIELLKGVRDSHWVEVTMLRSPFRFHSGLSVRIPCQ